MELKEFIKKSKEIKDRYDEVNQKNWRVSEYAQGLVGDVGDLLKLIMAKNQFRKIDDVDNKISHELSDCLWSILIIADELGVDLEHEFFQTMNELKGKIK
jgi:NTP pyrophosphatase (non-canonical NTP hydrolase)